MIQLEVLRADHSAPLYEFESRNREYFARTVPDRGDAFFAEFDRMFADRLAEQETGTIRMHVVVEDGEIVGRVNLVDVADGTAELGYRIGESASGRGVATAAVKKVVEVAATELGLSELRAETTVDNPASQAVLKRAGFTPVGETTLEGRPAIRYARPLRP
ncbi:ribosomal-protein-alanine N-acetyltransferase [Stackebrandtia albiflava]|uniref:Ribosomal-protein-alanine N-acetyltransferase n=1 Tax=Stackebrandtia albiflava TaxID=406432 RepID=A0A562VAI5_9ACTN|nr:GNAT family N-acetyltransferase [Stackebrandtia albiflava]TWJ14899.1 ribosomal-protein-alanine N-acetyltransferase [Stackebrandtia albiflava]